MIPSKKFTAIVRVIVPVLIFLLNVTGAHAQTDARSARQSIAGAIQTMLTGTDDASLGAFASEHLTSDYRASISETEMYDLLRSLRMAVAGSSGPGLERSAQGFAMVYRGDRTTRIEIQMEERSPWKITRLALKGEMSDTGDSETDDLQPARRERVRAIESLAASAGDEGIQRFIDNHLSDEYEGSIPQGELYELLRHIRSAGAAAGEISVSIIPDGVRIGFRGGENGDVVFKLEEASPFKISSLLLDTDVRDEESESVPPITWDTLEQRLDQAEENGFSGTVLVVRQGETILHRGYGMANRAREIPNTTDTIYGIGSTPIDFTRAAILLLDQLGDLDLSDSITRFISDVSDDKRSITIEHLMTGASGLPNFHHLPEVDEDYDLTWIDRETAVRRIMDQNLLFVPGEGKSHSHSAFVLLAAIIEIVSEQTYGEFLTEHFFNPAGMTRTGFYGPNTDFKENGVAVGYGMSAVGQINSPLYWGNTSWLVMGSGGMVSTPGDMYKWIEFLESGVTLAEDALETYRMRGVLAGGSDRGFLFMYTSGFKSRMFLSSNVNGMAGRETKGLADALARLVMSDG